MTANTVLGLSF